MFKAGILGFIAIVGIIGASIYGWVNNIIMLTGCDFHNVGGEIVLRVIGIFIAVLGIILGFVGHF